jgi:hypothetical protein
MAEDAGSFFMCILAKYTSSFENCLFNAFAYFLIEFFIFMVFNFCSTSCTGGYKTKYLVDIWWIYNKNVLI